MNKPRFKPTRLLLGCLLSSVLLLLACVPFAVEAPIPIAPIIIPDGVIPFAWLKGGTQLVLYAGSDLAKTMPVEFYTVAVDEDPASLKLLTEPQRIIDPVSLVSIAPNGQRLVFRDWRSNGPYSLVSHDQNLNLLIPKPDIDYWLICKKCAD